MSKSSNFTLTVNNPHMSIDEFFLGLKQDSVYARVQLERGESGTPHFQACVGYKSQRQLKAMIKRFPGAHIEIARNAMASWNYCGKSDSRVEGPLDHGVPPASKRVKGDTKARNALLIEYGPLRAVEDGLVPLEKFKQLKQSIDLYQVMKKST